MYTTQPRRRVLNSLWSKGFGGSTRTAFGFRAQAFKAPSRAITTRGVWAPRRSLWASSTVGIATAGAFAGLGAYYLSDNKLYADSVPLVGLPGTKNERTFIAVKPDGVQRGIVGEIIRRFEAKGYKLVAIKLIQPTQSFAEQHYQDLAKKPFFPGLVKYFSSGPVIAMVWEGKGVIVGGRALVGATNPAESLPGSIRGDLCIDIGRNIIHGSDSADGAKHEIALWFKESEVVNWGKDDQKWVYEK